jgi:hypothetical protein
MAKIKMTFRVPQILERVYSVEVDANDEPSAILAAVNKLKAANGQIEPRNGFIDNGNDVVGIKTHPSMAGYFVLNGKEFDIDGIERKKD